MRQRRSVHPLRHPSSKLSDRTPNPCHIPNSAASVHPTAHQRHRPARRAGPSASPAFLRVGPPCSTRSAVRARLVVQAVAVRYGSAFELVRRWAACGVRAGAVIDGKARARAGGLPAWDRSVCGWWWFCGRVASSGRLVWRACVRAERVRGAGSGATASDAEWRATAASGSCWSFRAVWCSSWCEWVACMRAERVRGAGSGARATHGAMR